MGDYGDGDVDDDELDEDDDELDEDEYASVLGLRGGAAMKKKAMAAMKAMKAMKAMAAMKAMKKKAMKKITARTAKRYAFAGRIGKSKGGLKKTDLVKNKYGKIVSKKMQARGLKSPWIAAVQKA